MKDISFYDEHRLAIIPLLPKSKKPILDEWPTRTPDDNDVNEFHSDSNIGVVLGEASTGIVDIDLDTLTAIELAPFFLPETGQMFGRKTAPNSHWIYRIKGDVGRRKAFTLNGKMFAEYRGNGCYTVFPDSTHDKTDEKIEWSKCEEPAVVSREELIFAIRKMAITAAVLPHYSDGTRHDLTNALSGTLLFHDMAIDDIKHIVQMLCDVTNDEEATDRINCVDTTAQRKSANQSVTGEEQLRELIGNDTVTSIIGYLGGRQHRSSTVASVASSQTSANIFSDDEMNDMGVAKRFAHKMRSQVAYVTELGAFHTYNGCIWQSDNGVQILNNFDSFIDETLRQLRNDGTIDHKIVNQQVTFLLKYRNRKRCEDAIALAKSRLAIPLSKLDANNDLIAVKNGILNLRTGTFLDIDPKYYITRQLNVDFDPSARCPTFEAFLNTTFEGDDDLISYVRAIFGYSLTPCTSRQEMYVLHGIGANGKSTLINAIRHILGDYSASLMRETLFDKTNNNTNADLARMISVRMAVVQEAESNLRLNAPRVKELTGGDTISVAPKFKNPFDLTPTFKMFVLCNQRPALNAHDTALLRRIKLLPFNHVVKRSERDSSLEQKLRAEASGILNWLLLGAKDYFDGNIRVPAKVNSATHQYINDNDSISGFLKDETINDSGSSVTVGELYESYVEYCTDECLKFEKKGDFGRIMKQRGFDQSRTKSDRIWMGLRMKTDGDDQNLFRSSSTKHLVVA